MAIATDIDPKILNSIIEKTLLSIPQTDRSIQKISDTVTSIHNAFNQIYTYSNNINKLSNVQYKTMLSMSKETSMETKLQNNILKVSSNVDTTELVKKFTGLSKSIEQLTERLSILDLSKQSQLDIDLDRKRRRGGRVGKFGKFARFGGLAGAGIVSGLVISEMLSEEEPEVLPEVTPTPVPAPQIEMPVPEVKPAPIQQPPTVTPPVIKTPVPVAKPPTVKPPEIKTAPVPVVKPPPVPEIPKPITKAPDAAAVSKSDTLGALSAKYESGNLSSIAIGYDTKGGTSYGKYQIASKTGTMNQFLNFIRDSYPDAYKILAAAGNPNTGSRKGPFVDAWKKVVSNGLLGDAEHQFIKKTHYDVAYNNLNSKPKQLVNTSKALQDVLWSTAVQHGGKGGSSIFNSVYTDGISADAYIKAIYAKRSTQFSGSSERERAGVLSRFKNESAEALASLNLETQPYANRQFAQNVPSSVQQPPSTSIISGTGKNTQTAAASSTAETFLAVQKRA